MHLDVKRRVAVQQGKIRGGFPAASGTVSFLTCFLDIISLYQNVGAKTP